MKTFFFFSEITSKSEESNGTLHRRFFFLRSPPARRRYPPKFTLAPQNSVLVTCLPTARHCCDISSNGAVLSGRNDAEIGPANSLHVSAYYSKNERFDLIRN